jgi:hypothetical protein
LGLSLFKLEFIMLLVTSLFGLLLKALKFKNSTYHIS